MDDPKQNTNAPASNPATAGTPTENTAARAAAAEAMTTPATPVAADIVPGQEVAKAAAVPTLEEQLEAAKVAMEGPERSAKRIEEEKEERVKGQESELQKKKDELGKQKEALELAWIDLDGKRGVIKKDLQPLLDQEAKIEEEEKGIEAEEERTALPAQKQLVEKKRWDIDDKRRNLEKQKWEFQDKLGRIEKQVEDNTKQYQVLLDEEEKINTQLEQLEIQLG